MTIAAEAKKRGSDLCPGVSVRVERIADIPKAPTGKRVLLVNRLRAAANRSRPEFTL